MEKLKKEKEVCGIYISGSPLDAYLGILKDYNFNSSMIQEGDADAESADDVPNNQDFVSDIKDGMIETAPANFDVDAGGMELIREEKLSETSSFCSLYEIITHLEGETPDKINTEFAELKREDVAQSKDNNFDYGYIWYNDDLEITKIVYYGLLENWE